MKDEYTQQKKRDEPVKTHPVGFYTIGLIYFVLSLNVATRLNSTCSKSLSVAPQPFVERRSAEILYLLTSIFFTASARASESFWFNSAEPSGEA